MQKITSNLNIIGGIAGTVLGGLILLSLGLYWLVEQATHGNTTAIILVTVFGFVLILTLGFSMYAGIAFVQAKLQRSAFENNMELMRMNAIENQQITNDVTRGLLNITKTQVAQSKVLSQPVSTMTESADYLEIDHANIIESSFVGNE